MVLTVLAASSGVCTALTAGYVKVVYIDQMVYNTALHGMGFDVIRSNQLTSATVVASRVSPRPSMIASEYCTRLDPSSFILPNLAMLELNGDSGLASCVLVIGLLSSSSSSSDMSESDEDSSLLTVCRG
jgi:hypothetical protein